MNSIFQALNSGYSPEEIIGFLSKAIPSIGPMVNKARKSGYQAQQILGFLSKSFGREDIKGLSENERHVANRRADAERAKFGLKAVATAAATPIVASATSAALSRALPASVQSLIGGQPPVSPLPGQTHNPPAHPAQNQLPSALAPTLQQPQQGQQAQVSPQQPPSQNIGNSIAQSTNNQQVPENNLEPLTEQDKAYKNIQERQKESERLFELAKEKRPGKEGTTPFMRMARDLVKKGQIRDAEEFDEFRKYWVRTEGQRRGSPLIEFESFRSQRPKFQEPQQEPAKLSPALQGQENPINSDILPSNSDKTAQFGQNNSGLREKIAQMPKLSKDSTVISPIGLGRIKELRNGKAMLDVDGKKHVVNEDELIASPLPEKDLAELYEDMVSGIQKKTGQEMSRNVNWAGYDPKSNELAYRPHDGRLYVYDEISPEDAAELTSLLNTRKTTGENFIGAWQSGSQSPIGAAMSRLILKLQKERGGKGNEYSGKFETLYDAIEPAVKAAKAKHAEERKRKKKA